MSDHARPSTSSEVVLQTWRGVSALDAESIPQTLLRAGSSSRTWARLMTRRAYPWSDAKSTGRETGNKRFCSPANLKFLFIIHPTLKVSLVTA